MKYLRNLLYIKRPSNQTLLDIAIVLSILPHLFILKSFMVVYVGVSLYFILKKNKRKYATGLLFVVGVFCIALSFFSNYNFSDFSRMQFFISLISSLLILAITLQRTTDQINFYIKASPVMLMMLSFFFFNTLSMLLYSLFVFFMFILLSVWARMETNLAEVLKFNLALFLLSLPIVIVLFISFPRIAFKKADFGFRADQYAASGYSGSMSVSDIEVRPSNKVVMEVFFKDKIPHEDALYFRGSTLYPSDNYEFKENSYINQKGSLKKLKNKVDYDALIYPHGEKWLFTLDVPINVPKGTILQNDHTLQAEKRIYEKKRFSFESALFYTYQNTNTPRLLSYNKNLYHRTYKALKSLKDKDLSLNEKAQKLMHFFREQNISYTTTPKNLDKDDVIDSFLFDAKNGYCTHFASSFAIAARIVGIPSRVVSGYKGSYKNKVENYIIIKQEDAHAWVELYLPQRGWSRFEPTATHTKNLDLTKKKKGLESFDYFQKINKQYMYVKYLVSNWILRFDRLKQMTILYSLLNDTVYLFKFLAAIVLIIFVSLFSFSFVRSWKSKSKLEKFTDKLLKLFAKKGLHKVKHESMEHFLKSSEKKLGISLKNLNELYHLAKYSDLAIDLKLLEKELLIIKHSRK